jgi:hypothetical protein
VFSTIQSASDSFVGKPSRSAKMRAADGSAIMKTPPPGSCAASISSSFSRHFGRTPHVTT